MINFKVLLCFLLTTTSVKISLSQRNTDTTLLTGREITAVSCNKPPVGACNQISNHIFSSTCFGTDPFINCVSQWALLTGSPQLNLGNLLPIAGANHSSMWSISHWGDPLLTQGESIVTAVPQLTAGHKYLMTFYRRARPDASATNTSKLDLFNITFLTCDQYAQVQNDVTIHDDRTPQVPSGAQNIYCETDLTQITNFERVGISFTANAAYEILWITPRQISWAAQQWWLDFGYPELIDVTNFSAGNNIPPTNYPNCNVTIGPAQPNCGVSGAVFSWRGPSGQVINAPASQQIQVDASNGANVGTWTLRMTIPGLVTTNNNCSDNSPVILNSITVASCCVPQPPPPPQIVTVQIPLWNTTEFTSFDPNYPGISCWNISSGLQHGHYQYVNFCLQSCLMSGYMNADNSRPSNQKFVMDFVMITNDNVPGGPRILQFPQNGPSSYEPCYATDIISANLKMFHFPSLVCDPYQGWLNEYNLTVPHNGNNAFRVKRTANADLVKSCKPVNTPYYTLASLPAFTSDVVNLPATSTSVDDVTVNVTQMIKNAINNGDPYIGFFVEQLQSSTFNNVLFNGMVNHDLVVDPLEPYIELTYVRRELVASCDPGVRLPGARIATDVTKPDEKTPVTGNGNLAIFPNPSNDFVWIKGLEKGAVISIYTSDNRFVKKLTANDPLERFNIKDLNTGIYLFTIQTKKAVNTIKFIKVQ